MNWKKYTLNKRDLLQVKTFQKIFRKNIQLGLCYEAAFIDAIIATSDTAFRKIEKFLSER